MKTKNVLLVLVLLLVLIMVPSVAAAADGDVAINATNFPDDAFRNIVTENFDTDKNGVLSAAEISAAIDLEIEDSGISNLKGIEYLTALQFLDCSVNSLTALDVSKNTALVDLYCAENELTSLDVSRNTALVMLSCSYNKLSSLDVSKNTQLWGLYCYYNELTALDVSKNTSLVELDFESNQVTSLDVSKNTKLNYLYCADNQLDSLDVSKNTALEYLYCYVNHLTSLDVSRNTALTVLSCYDNSLSKLDLSKNSELKSLICYYNELTELDLSKNTKLEELDCEGNYLKSLDLSKCPSMDYLWCVENQLSSINVSACPDLRYLFCSDNQLTSLDVSKNTKLEELYCFDNHLSALNISYCPNMLTAYSEGTMNEYNNGSRKIYIYYYSAGGSTPGYYLGVDSDTGLITDRPQATVSGISLNLEGKISVQFKIKPSDEAAYAELRYEKEEGGYGDVVAKVSLDKASSPAYQKDSDLFLVSYSEITSREMTLHVMLNIYDKNGNPMDIYRTTNEIVYAPNTLVFCAADWANAIIDKYGTDKSNKSSWMAMALLNFGQEAQKYFKDFNSDAPANPKAYLAADMSSFKVDTANNNVESANARKYGFSGSTLDLAADTTLRVKFNGNYAVKLDGKTASTILDSGKYVLDITGLRCIDLDQKFTVTFTGDGGSGTLTLSALGWCNAIIDKYGSDASNQSARLAKAVCLYSQAAENYFKK